MLFTRDDKTQKLNTIEISPQLQRAIEAVEEKYGILIARSDELEYSKKLLSKTLNEWCNQAQLRHCSAHGLRKAMTRGMAECEATSTEMKAIMQHAGDAEMAVYTRGEDQIDLTTKAIKLLSDTTNRKGRWLTRLKLPYIRTFGGIW